jgi:hypothetical protein
LVDELIRTVLPERERKDGGHDHDDVKIWERLCKEIGALLPIRNRLAHHPIQNKQLIQVALPGAEPISGAAADLLTFSWYESYISEAERLRGQHENIMPLSTVDLSAHRVEIEMIITKLDIFRSSVLSKYVE